MLGVGAFTLNKASEFGHRTVQRERVVQPLDVAAPLLSDADSAYMLRRACRCACRRRGASRRPSARASWA